jgi:hypothetical protein
VNFKIVSAYVISAAALSFLIPLAAGAQKASPCSSSERHQFDFWLGNWRVVDAAGAFQGTNNVTSEFKGCVVQEHWKGAEGGRGSSFNTYLSGRKQWQQTWVDSHGLTLLLFGSLQGNSMVLSGTRVTSAGTVTDRITWTPLSDGRVRQHWQEADHKGKWEDVFDGYYRKIERDTTGA